MLIYSIRSSTVKLIGVLLIAVLCAVALMSGGETASVYASAEGITVRYDGIDDAQDRIAFIGGFGISVDASSVGEEKYRMPDDFARVIGGYNQIQRRQGLDLERYKNRRVTHYCYTVTNCTERATVNLYQYRDRIIACDLTLTDSATVHPLTEIPKGKFK